MKNPPKTYGTNAFLDSESSQTFENVCAGLMFLQDVERFRQCVQEKECEADFTPSGSYGLHLVIESLRMANEKQNEVLVADERVRSFEEVG